MRDGLPQRGRIRLQQPLASQARRGRPGRPGFRAGLLLAGSRRGPRDLPVAGGDRKPDQIRQPLVDQGHLAALPGHDRGQHLHGLTRLPALLQRHRVRGDQEVLVLPVGASPDGQGQARAELLISRRTLVPAPGDERGHAVDQQRWPALAQECIREPGSIALVRAQLGQRVVPLAQPVPQHRGDNPGRAIGIAAALSVLAGLLEGQLGFRPAVEVLQREDPVVEVERAQVRVAGIVAEHVQCLVNVV